MLKRILPRLSASGDFKTMFVREAKICAQMTHPNIIQIYEFGQADGGYFIAMESVQGVTLREALTTLRKDERAMPHLIAADVARQICIGLDYAHTLRGPDGAPLEIVHQDISPTNIMLAFTGTVKILDFGIARAAEFAEEEAKKGLIKGKVSYLSPEQIYVRPFDARADVFALGVVFHEMLTGRRLFQSKNDITKMRELLAAPILPPSAIDAMIPRELDRIVMKALAIDPKDRYQSAADMAAEFERTLIAARYSSRELSKLLHALYLAGDDPLIVVDASDEKDALEGPSPSRRRGRCRRPSRPARRADTPDSPGSRQGRDADADGHRGARRALAPGTEAVDRAAEGHGHRAGRGRRARRRLVRGQEVLARSAAAAAAGGDAGHEEPGGAAGPAPAAKPSAVPLKATKKRVPSSSHKGKGHGAAAAAPAEETTEKPAVEDAPMPPSAE